MTRMKAERTAQKLIRLVCPHLVVSEFVSVICAGVFALPIGAWSQTPEWRVYNTSNSGLPYNGVTGLALDANGTVWIGTGKWLAYEGGGLAKFDGENWTVYNTANSGLPHNDHSGLAIDPQGNIWSGTEGGLAQFDGKNWIVYNTSNSVLTHYPVSTPSFDSLGNLWIGSWGGGLAKFDGVNWTVYNTSNSGLPHNTAWTTALDVEGNLWVGTMGGGLTKFDSANWTVYNTGNSGLPNNNVVILAFDTQGSLWIATDGGGLAEFDGQNWRVYNASNSGLSHNRVWCLALDAQGNKWIGTYGGGLAKFDGQNWTVHNTSNSGLPEDRVYSLVIDAQGRIWIGTESGGLAVYHPGRPVDLDGDEKVNFTDFSLLAQYWHQGESPFCDYPVDCEYLCVLAECWLADLRLIAHWKLDETEGTTAYDSVGDYDGTLHGGLLWQADGGKIDGALEFGGGGDYISTDFALDPVGGSFSVFAWVKGGAPGKAIISQANVKVGRTVVLGSTWLGTDVSDGTLVTTLMGSAYGPLKSDSAITDGRWHHVGLVYDLEGLCRRLYVDGLEVARDSSPVGGVSSTGSLYFGAGQALDAGTLFCGLIDDVCIYNAALSAKEIEEMVR